MKKIGVCGNFAYRKNISNGQIIKTRTVTQELIKQYGQDNVITVDTNSWKEQPLKLFVKCIYLAISSENIIIFPAHNGIKVFGPLFSVLSFLFRKNYTIR